MRTAVQAVSVAVAFAMALMVPFMAAAGDTRNAVIGLGVAAAMMGIAIWAERIEFPR